MTEQNRNRLIEFIKEGDLKSAIYIIKESEEVGLFNLNDAAVLYNEKTLIESELKQLYVLTLLESLTKGLSTKALLEIINGAKEVKWLENFSHNLEEEIRQIKTSNIASKISLRCHKNEFEI